MRPLCILLLFPIFSSALLAQKEDNVWLLGGNFNSPDSLYKACRIDFGNDPLSITYIDKGLPYDFTNASICNSSGQLLCFSNGKNIYNRDYIVMDGGSNFYPAAAFEGGVPYLQGYMLLPMPGDSNKVVYIYGNPKVVFPPSGANIGYIKLRYAVVDMSQNNGLGKVVQRDILAGTDTVSFMQMTAVRHGNGRDWWVVIPHYVDHIYYRYLLSPQGLHYVDKQSIATTNVGLGQACFSPDGQWYARFNGHGILPDSAFSTFDLYHFDRCYGLLSDRITKTYDFSGLAGKPGGVAFSPSSRYLYVTRWDSIFQYDLQAPDIAASEVTVAVYDYFADELGLPTRFFYPLLAPDNKIYICVSNYNSSYLHVIENPDSAGLGCNIQQHTVRLPVSNNTLLPNMPYYRLGKWIGSPCDTLNTVSTVQAPRQGERFLLFPNPANSEIQLSFAGPVEGDCRIEIFDLTGQLVGRQKMAAGETGITVQTGLMQNGIYLLCVRENGRLTGQQKFSILH